MEISWWWGDGRWEGKGWVLHVFVGHGRCFRDNTKLFGFYHRVLNMTYILKINSGYYVRMLGNKGGNPEPDDKIIVVVLQRMMVA